MRSSENQAEYGLRKVAEMSSEEYPAVYQVVKNDTYVDDCMSGAPDTSSSHKLADDLEMILNKGGFQLKGVSFSGEDPPEKLTDDGETIHVAGTKWFPKEDTLALNIGELNFSKKTRGKKPSSSINIIPSALTRRHCASKVAEVFDLTGRIAPITASMKIDIQELIRRKLNWDDTIPDDLRPLWETNFEMMQDLRKLRFNRAIVPDDAVDLNLNTLDFGDASKSMICSCIYARFKKKDGTFSCQLVLARTKVVPQGMSLPRAELTAALTNTFTGEVVRRSFKGYHQGFIKFTDNQACLYWITNNQIPLKEWVRNRVIEIQRFSTTDQWHYIQSEDMIADIGTRKGATLHDVDKRSVWQNGFMWMKLDSSNFPMSSPDRIKLSDAVIKEVNIESETHISRFQKVPDEVEKRYKFSSYVIDPNQHSFTKVVRILAYVQRFCRNLRRKTRISDQSMLLNDQEIAESEAYFFKKATQELHQFVPPKRYENISRTKNGLLIYRGRMLASDQVTIVGRFTEAMKDLSQCSFNVPVIDKESPVAYIIALDTHWNHPVARHTGVETNLRFIMKKTYILDERTLVKSIRRSCQRCRYIMKKTIDVAMGPISNANITIAPAFYSCQVDLSGPYYAYSPLHKRTTVKIWLTVFCCCTTSAVSIKVMDDYSTDGFIMSFIRFACTYGFPKRLYCDGGSQILKGCGDMKLNYQDIKSKLHQKKKVDFSICPVGGHNMHGKVERKIQEINKSIERSIHNQRLSLMQWETLSSIIANSINDLPIAIGSKVDLENLDLITPNRLLLSRNNDRGPVGEMITLQDPSKLLKENQKIFNTWFESWLLNHVPNLMHQQKWFNGNNTIQVGDVVLFTKTESPISTTYQYGIISRVEQGKDDVGRKVYVRYRNSSEEGFRETFCSVRGLVLIRSVDELDILEELGKMSKCV